MILPRVIPVLLLRGSGLVKTVRYKDPVYVGDPRNAVKIFNEREVDELILLDIQATPQDKAIQYELVQEIVSEAFMPVGYGGGVKTVEQARRLAAIGIEKIVLGTAAVHTPGLVSEVARLVGSSSTVVSIDYKKNLFGRPEVHTHGGRKRSDQEPVAFAAAMAERGAGELVINAIDRDGTMEGYDLDILRAITQKVNIPVIACCGAGNLEHLRQAIYAGGASAVAAGSLFVFQGRHRAVLINYPTQAELRQLFT